MKNLKLGVVVGGFLLCQNANAITMEYCGYLLEECEKQARTQGCIYNDTDERCFVSPNSSESTMSLFLQGHPYVNTICNQWSSVYDIDLTGCRIMCAQAAANELFAWPSYYAPVAEDFELYCGVKCGYGEHAQYTDYRSNISGEYAASATCVKCPAGTYMNASGHTNTSCIDCGPGHAANPGSRLCKACSAGQYSEPGWSTCQCCPENTYSDDGKTCKPCPMLDDVSGVYEATCGDGIEVCYIPEDVQIHDETGTYEFTTTCWWTYY